MSEESREGNEKTGGLLGRGGRGTPRKEGAINRRGVAASPKKCLDRLVEQVQDQVKGGKKNVGEKKIHTKNRLEEGGLQKNGVIPSKGV